MVKVLLLIEDYNELVATETMLKKVGFDCMGMTNENSLVDTLISFRPEVVIANGRGQRVSGVSVGKKIREIKSMSFRLVLFFPRNHQPDLAEISSIRLDAILESPVDPTRLLEVLAKLNNLKIDPLLEKFHRFKQQSGVRLGSVREDQEVGGTVLPQMQVVQGGLGAPSAAIVTGGKAPTASEDHARVAKYDSYLKGIQFNRNESKHTKAEARARIRSQQSRWDMTLIQSIDDLRKDFAKALFKKKG